MKAIIPRYLSGLLWLAASAASTGEESLAVGTFSRETEPGKSPGGWELFLPNPSAPPTRYTLERDNDVMVVRADADRSMAGLLRKVNVDPSRMPFLCWRWKIAAPLRGADMATKPGDDYAARLYVLYDYDTDKLSWDLRAKLALVRGLYGVEVPAAALNYVWDNRYPPGTVRPNAYTDRTLMWVLRSGAGEARRWVTEVRDVAADFRAAFGEEEVPPVSGVVIATDTDNTGEQATAWFGDIRFAARRELCRP